MIIATVQSQRNINIHGITDMATPLFEHTICGRCGGCGRYSYNQIDGDRCFGCLGTGFALTRRGNAAQEFYRNLLTVLAGDVTVGMRVKDNAGSKFTVADIERAVRGHRIVDGEKIALEVVSFTSVGGNRYGYSATVHMTMIPSEAQRSEMVAKALAYQDTLTRAGSPRVRVPA